MAQSGIPNITWQERGPSNVGGRTRALLFDPNDPTHKKVWAGSLAGGLWYTNDITDANAGWTPVSDAWENLVVTTLAADPSNPQVMYAGTGDGYNYVQGGGIWKTTNGGTTWTRLSSTIPSSNSPAVNSSFRYIQKIIVNASGQVLVATQFGVVRSADGGTTWQYALAPNQGIGVGTTTNNYYNDLVTDLELASDGVLYVSFNPSRVFKSTNATGTTWIEITPVGITGERTELALDPSSSGVGQIIYGVSRKYNSVKYGQDVTWFKKSTNGGTTWVDLAIPTFSWGDHFTYGNGYNALNLIVHPTEANTVYAGGNDWFRSVDGGVSWGSPFTNQYQYQQGLWFQPGNGTNVALTTDNGVFWSTDWGHNSVIKSTISDRNNGFRVGQVSSVSMRSGAGSSFLLAGVGPIGYIQMTSPGLSTGSQIWGINFPGLTFIDEDESSVQLIQTGNSFYRYSPSNSAFLTSVNSYYSTIAADYDSPLNTLYVGDNTNNQSFIKKITNVGTTPVSTTLALAGVLNLGSYLKLNTDRTKLFFATGAGQIYRVSNLDQSTPTVLRIDNGALPQSYISCIDVGANDDELLVTFTNYGTQSVWYTNNGGTTWTGKDQTNFGLPDIPVRSALFIPQNRKQVLLATDAGIWSTNDITAINPGWSFSGNGMGGLGVNQLRYRASDGRMTAATSGRGIFISDAFAIPYSLPSITLTSVSNRTLCAGNTFTVSFTTAGAAFTTGNTFEVWLSDATGSFTNARKIGSSTTSPITATLPIGSNALPYGTNYQIKVMANNPEVESSPSGAMAIGNLGSASIYDRRTDINQYWNGGTVCVGGQARLKAYTYTTYYAATSAADYQWFFNGSSISGATSASILSEQAGKYTVIAKQGGCTITSNSYVLNTSPYPYSSIESLSNGEPQCIDHPLKLSSNYIGEFATYQWTREGVDITGATSYTYLATQSGNYSYRVNDNLCNSLASTTYLQFGQSLLALIALTSNGDSLICTGSSNYNTMIYADIPSSNDYTVQWYRNGSLLSGETSRYYYTSQAGTYSFLLKQGSCQTRSNAIVINQSDQFKASIRYSFKSKVACPGETRNLSAFPSNNGSFQWQKDGVNIAGATSIDYQASVSGKYSVQITKGSCSATSDPLSLTFSNTIQPQLILTETCSDIGIDANLYNLSYTIPGYQYQWYKNGVLINAGTNSYYYSSQSDRSGTYSVRVTNGSCTGLSKEVYATSGNVKTPKPILDISPKSLQLCTGSSSRLAVNSYRGSLQWKRNGVIIPQATSSSYYATQSGIYSVVVQDGSCSAESDPVEIKIGEATTATLSGNALISAGQSTKLPITFTGPAPWSVSLTNGQSLTATYQNPAFITVSPSSNTTYQLASVINACGTGTTSGQASVSVGTGSADVSLNMAVSNRTPNVGDLVSYTLSATNAGPDNAAGIQLSSLLPTGLAFVSSPSSGASAANGIVSVNLGTIQANTTRSVSFLASPTLPGTFATAAQLTASQTPDPDSQPNSGTGDGQDDAVMVDLRTPVAGTLVNSANPNQLPLPRVATNQPATDPNTADLSLSLQMDKLSALTTEVLSTSVTVSNRGGSSASSIVVEVVLPNGTASPVSQVNWVAVSGQVYKGYINQLAAGQSATLVLRWQPTGSGTLKAQVLDLYESDSDSTPGNGYGKGEDDEAAIQLRIR